MEALIKTLANLEKTSVILKETLEKISMESDLALTFWAKKLIDAYNLEIETLICTIGICGNQDQHDYAKVIGFLNHLESLGCCVLYANADDVYAFRIYMILEIFDAFVTNEFVNELI